MSITATTNKYLCRLIKTNLVSVSSPSSPLRLALQLSRSVFTWFLLRFLHPPLLLLLLQLPGGFTSHHTVVSVYVCVFVVWNISNPPLPFSIINNNNGKKSVTDKQKEEKRG